MSGESTDVTEQWIGTEAGQVAKRFETWEKAEEWREGHARDVSPMPQLEENDRGGDDFSTGTQQEADR